VHDALALAASGRSVIAAGFNCAAPSMVRAALAAAPAKTPKVAYPNSGERWDPVARRFVGAAEEDHFGAVAKALSELGAEIIGGCCRTTPADVAAIRAALRPE
jgi:homocysteine S-methyltransferase